MPIVSQILPKVSTLRKNALFFPNVFTEQIGKFFFGHSPKLHSFALGHLNRPNEFWLLRLNTLASLSE